MKSLTSKFASSRGWALLLILFLGAGLLVSACGDEEVPTPTTPTPPPPPPPTPPPEPEPEPEPPATPTGLAVSATTENSITWTWSAVEGATAYAVQISMDEMFGDDDVTALALTATYTASDLPPATTVYARVAAGVGTSLEDALLSEWSTHVTGMTATPPPPPEPPAVPSGLQVSASGEDFVEWSWSAVEGADGYEVQFSTNEMFDDAETIGRTADQTSYRRQPLPAGATAYVRIRSYSGSGEDRLESEWSTHVTGMTDQPMPPATPANLQASACGEGCLEWTWDEVEGAGGYVVQYSLDDERFTDQDATAEVAATETSYRLENLAADMDVYLRVRSFAGSGADRLESGWSTHATGMTVAPPPMAPATPTGLDIAGMGDDFIEWSWDAVSGAEGYEVQISENSQFGDEDPIRDAGTALSYRQGDLDYETRRYLRVRAYIGSGADRLSSDWSGDATSVTNAAPPPPPAPAIPRINVPATGGEGLVTWSWGAVDGAGGYQIWYSANDAFTGTDPMEDLDNETLSYTRENLEAGTTHYLRVRSYIEVDGTRYYSEWTSQVSGETDALRPAVPTGLAVDAAATDHNSIGWTWDAVEGATSYEAQFSADETFTDADQIFTRRGTSHTVDRLAAETDGHLRVRAVMGTGASATRSDWSEASAGKTTAEPEPDPLSIPANLEASDEGRSSITLTWDTVDDADHYEVEQRADGGNWTDASCDGGDNTVEDTSCEADDLQSGTDYDFRVRAVPDSGDDDLTDSAWTTVSARTTGSGPATPVTGGMGDLNVSWKSDENSITWTWEPMTGVTYEWDVTDDEVYNSRSNPCTAADWTANSGATFEAEAPGLSRGDVRLLCVRTTDEDNRALSFSWGVATPEVFGNGTISPAGDTGMATTSITWGSINVSGGFNYEMKVVADPVSENAIDGGNADDMAVQMACSAGDSHENGNTDVALTGLATTYRDVDPHTGYLLCVRMTNDGGETAWAVPSGNAEAVTVPGMAPTPDYNSADSSQTDTTETVVWDVETRGEADIPRAFGNYNVRTIKFPARANLDSDAALESVRSATRADCGATDNNGAQDQFMRSADLNSGLVLTSTGFTVTVTENRKADTDPDDRIQLCVQAENGNLVGPWQISGPVTIENQDPAQ